MIESEKHSHICSVRVGHLQQTVNMRSALFGAAAMLLSETTLCGLL